MQIESLGLTHAGRVRAQNEDRFFVNERLGLMVVCDGMGGHAAGEVAAEIAVRHIESYLASQGEHLRRIAEQTGTISQVAKILAAAVQGANQAVYDEAARQPRFRGMGTTLTLALVSGDAAVVVQVGDSRLYLIRAGKAHQVTADHTVECELRRRGVAMDDEARQSRLARMLTRSVGEHPVVHPDTYLLGLQPNDVLVCCSDGLTRYLTTEQELVGVCGHSDLASAATWLVDLAISRGGADNVTVVLGRTQPSRAGHGEPSSPRSTSQHVVVGFEAAMPVPTPWA